VQIASLAWLHDFLVGYGYWAIMIMFMLESAGVPMPGETTLVAAAGRLPPTMARLRITRRLRLVMAPAIIMVRDITAGADGGEGAAPTDTTHQGVPLVQSARDHNVTAPRYSGAFPRPYSESKMAPNLGGGTRRRIGAMLRAAPRHPGLGREALDCRHGGERRRDQREPLDAGDVPCPSTRRAAAPGPMPVARSAARPVWEGQFVAGVDLPMQLVTTVAPVAQQIAPAARP